MQDALAKQALENDKEKAEAVDKAKYETFMRERNEMRNIARSGGCMRSAWWFPID